MINEDKVQGIIKGLEASYKICESVDLYNEDSEIQYIKVLILSEIYQLKMRLNPDSPDKVLLDKIEELKGSYIKDKFLQEQEALKNIDVTSYS